MSIKEKFGKELKYREKMRQIIKFSCKKNCDQKKQLSREHIEFKRKKRGKKGP